MIYYGDVLTLYTWRYYNFNIPHMHANWSCYFILWNSKKCLKLLELSSNLQLSVFIWPRVSYIIYTVWMVIIQVHASETNYIARTYIIYLNIINQKPSFKATYSYNACCHMVATYTTQSATYTSPLSSTHIPKGPLNLPGSYQNLFLQTQEPVDLPCNVYTITVSEMQCMKWSLIYILRRVCIQIQLTKH